eukprot:CAMPEP_0180514358 /NCGR_PEP_ID=MMETSP1036_2-20121128/52683_1 /TAXON_ID=632150 /ORGANISM="Azadinium spinosum, Strain 3D9" /LENGTH=46 /DNA_ID= /DNA_START= /DNA_END= /DNA_ORIENTATION=
MESSRRRTSPSVARRSGRSMEGASPPQRGALAEQRSQLPAKVAEAG